MGCNGDSQMRSKMLKVRLTEEEYEQLKTFAKKHHTNVSSVIRWYIKAIHEKE